MLDAVFFHNTIRDYLVTLGLFTGTILFLKTFEAVGLGRLRKLAVKTASTVDDFLLGRVHKDANPILYASAFWIASRRLTLSGQALQIVNGILTIIITFFGIRFAAALATFLVENHWSAGEKNEFRTRNLRGMTTIIRGVLWSLGVVFAIDNLGFQISAIVAGMGIGGVAVALAAQAILSDLFSYAAIFFDRPFEVDDFIIVGDYMGTIEYIGLKTTRIRSLGGEQIIIAQ
jgi:small-conductance mechanosensitive channel